jgi:glutamine cyclotransferase
MIKIKQLVLISLSLLFLFSCTNDQKEQTSNKEKKQVEQKPMYRAKIDIVSPKAGLVITRGDSVTIELSIFDDQRKINSLEYYANGTKIEVKNNKIATANFKSGRNSISVKSINNDNSTDKVSSHVICLSDITPKTYKVKVLNKYEHNVTAYTQGLLFADGYLYEGTGQNGESMLKKIDLEKNSLIQSYNLPREVFGEGIVLHGHRIFQLTWRSRRAFVYDLKTFSLLNEFQYDTEGWGITNFEGNLIMSDGSQNLMIIDPSSFLVIDKMQVSDNVGPINNLNELEWINGKIWANVYLTNTIVIIDPKTGFVEKKLDLTDLVPDTFANPHDNVLNGIAYDKETGRIYVTGKRWPVLYQIEVIE